MWKHLVVMHAEKKKATLIILQPLSMSQGGRNPGNVQRETQFQTAAHFCVQRNKIKVTQNKGSGCGEKQESKLRATLAADAVKLVPGEAATC